MVSPTFVAPRNPGCSIRDRGSGRLQLAAVRTMRCLFDSNTEKKFAAAYESLGWPDEHVTPVVYSEDYNIHFFGIEKLHPFDASKFRKIVTVLLQKGTIPKTVGAQEVAVDALLDVHTPEYINALHISPKKAAEVIELPPLRFLPSWLLQRLVLRKMRTHVGGTMLAAALAMKYGWAVNMGGGLHHAHHSDGSGWCAYSDITLAIRKIRSTTGRAVRVMVIDTDAHQGNGYERDKLHFDDTDTYIVDLYNADAFPKDRVAEPAIDVNVKLRTGCDSETYLSSLDQALETAYASFQPELVIHNAGTDILDGDPLGRMNVSMDSIVERDWRVWQRCRKSSISVVMLLSGGYASTSAATVTASLSKILESEQSTNQA